MASSSIKVHVRVRTGWATAWIQCMRVLAPFIGRRRAFRWGIAGANRLIRVETD